MNNIKEKTIGMEEIIAKTKKSTKGPFKDYENVRAKKERQRKIVQFCEHFKVSFNPSLMGELYLNEIKLTDDTMYDRHKKAAEYLGLM